MELSSVALGISPSMTLKIDALAKEMRSEGADVIGFGAGEPDFDTPRYIKDAAIAAINAGKTKYTPAAGLPELRQAICDRYERKYGLVYSPDQIAVASGAKHSLFNIFQVMLNRSEEVIIIAPYWLTYPEQVRMADGVPVVVNTKFEDGFQADIKDIENAITQRTRAIIVNSPSNPTGCVYSKEVLEGIAQLAKKHDLYIISDEIYDELVYVDGISSIAQIPGMKERTIVVNGLSKSHAMTGWRLGYAIMPKDMAKVMTAYQSQSTSSPSTITQYAGIAALSDVENSDKSIAEMLKVYDRRAELMTNMINAIPGISMNRPEGAFYGFVCIKGVLGKYYKGRRIDNSLDFSECLLQANNVAVVPGCAFGVMEYMRLSFAISDENIKRGIERIGEFVAELTD